jgi:ATPase subunit of ABC transporter with duplicated ATPase domains
MGEQYIFTIEQLTKIYNKKEVLKNIWLSFYPGAKIGVIGGNGAGKSTLMRVMAGVDKDFMGTARPAPNIRIGHVPQEPRLDETTDVRGNLEKSVAPIRALLNREEEIGTKMAEATPEEMDKLMDEMDCNRCSFYGGKGWAVLSAGKVRQYWLGSGNEPGLIRCAIRASALLWGAGY